MKLFKITASTRVYFDALVQAETEEQARALFDENPWEETVGFTNEPGVLVNGWWAGEVDGNDEPAIVEGIEELPNAQG